MLADDETTKIASLFAQTPPFQPSTTDRIQFATDLCQLHCFHSVTFSPSIEKKMPAARTDPLVLRCHKLNLHLSQPLKFGFKARAVQMFI